MTAHCGAVDFRGLKARYEKDYAIIRQVKMNFWDSQYLQLLAI
jgi:hypothetical protein